MQDTESLKLLRAVDESVAAHTGKEFFPQLVRALARSLGAHCAFVSEFDHANYCAQVLAFYCDDAFADPFQYPLAGSPCECVLDGQIVAFQSRIQEMFPVERDALAQIGAESYLAIPLVDATGKVQGHLAVIDRKSRDWNEADRGILRIFSTRAATEIERRNNDRKLESVNDALQKANAQLRRELANRLEMEEQLARAKQAAESANHAKSTFLAHMSHELRTPLNGILGYAQLLRRDTTLGETQQESISVIERSGEHLLTLINELLDLAKIEAGKLELHPGVFDLHSMLMHVADLTGVRARQAGLGFEYAPSPGLPALVEGDERAIRQVLLNLLGNAVKFTESGGVKFRVGGETSDGRIALRCEIEDSGVGIAAGELDRLFEPFERSGEHRRRVEGTGLGLTITRRLLEAMGGKLQVTSSPGSGSVFSFELELPVREMSARIAPSPLRITGYEGVRRRVLIADDEQTNRLLLVKLLGELGFETGQAGNGAEALRAISACRPDVLITDLAMPVMDGLAVARALRRDPATQALPVLAVSASASDYTRDEAIHAGCTEFLPKPIRAAELLQRLSSLLDLQWIQAEEAGDADSSPTLNGHPAGAPPDASIAAELYDLAMKGEVKALISRAEQATREHPASAPLYEELSRLARNYDMKGVRRRIAVAQEAKA
jgi:signal transduction histidine kinase/DNA-binding NarL/FixJ family response regulator